MQSYSSRTKRWYLLGLILIISLACQFLDPSSEPTSTPIPPPTLDELTFEDPQTETRFKTLNQCIEGIADETWHTTSYKLIGNFYESRWCSGVGAREDCQIAYSTMHNRDQRQVGLNTLFYPDQPTTVFGLGFETLWVPESAGWGVEFYFSEKGKTIIGEGWGIIFNRYDNAFDPPAESVVLGDSLSYKIIQTTLQQSSDLPLREDLDIYLSNAESMRDRGVEQYQIFLSDIKSKFNNHEITACDWSEYQGDGLPPVCTPRPMTPDEEAAELEKARQFYEGQIQLLQENYQEMYAVLMDAFPFDECWE